jgi:hypothetical protein
MANPKASTSSSEWYQTERNTEALVKAVMAVRSVRGLSGEDLWSLIRLTWVTSNGERLIERHWQQLKVPALAQLLKKDAAITDDLAETLASMKLPKAVMDASFRKTGMVNAYRAYRNSLLDWCTTHRDSLRVSSHRLRSWDRMISCALTWPPGYLSFPQCPHQMVRGEWRRPISSHH